MARKTKTDDRNQMPLMGFEMQVDHALRKNREVGQALRNLVDTGPSQDQIDNEFELCHAIAAALKRELERSSLSRPTFCDKVNEYLGRTQERYKQTPSLCRKPLTQHTLNKMISDPIHYPVNAYYLFAFQHVLKGFGVIGTIVNAKGAKVVTGDDIRRIAQVKAAELRQTAQEIEKQIGRM
ncbi:MAG: hypothetical protein MI862_12705 [Desulfobacterales bacterium]|nr:hypothetical protein [Desulfobacterales bacterium]